MQKLNLMRIGLCLLLAVLGLTMTGCATTEAENASPRPWNSPTGWEGGLPSGLYDKNRR